MKVTFVPGTHAWDGEKKDWYSPGSEFYRACTAAGIEELDPANPYVWSSRLGGTDLGRDTAAELAIWRAAGINFYQYYIPPRCKHLRVPPADSFALTHSHGLQPVLFACAMGLQLDLLVDVAGPVREDMMPIARAARRNIRRWIHIHAGKRDRWQWFGTIGDGHLGIVREHKYAHVNHPVPQADHGEVLRDKKYHPLVIDFLLGKR